MFFIINVTELLYFDGLHFIFDGHFVFHVLTVNNKEYSVFSLKKLFYIEYN